MGKLWFAVLSCAKDRAQIETWVTARSGYRAFLIGLAEALTDGPEGGSIPLCIVLGVSPGSLVPRGQDRICRMLRKQLQNCEMHVTIVTQSCIYLVIESWIWVFLLTLFRFYSQTSTTVLAYSRTERSRPTAKHWIQQHLRHLCLLPSLPKWLNGWFHSGCQGIVMAKKREDFRRILELSRLSGWKYWKLNWKRAC